ncbi:MAG: 4Fe-4S dicluster domain-containing protein [Candidatus Micrarchaeota archaeon]|nr:4Fe-4S dicluster domain-containing protein [Candidatus Micrarchaeota archaeon]
MSKKTSRPLKGVTGLVAESEIPYHGVRGIPHIREPGNAVRRKTGNWRIFKPVIDLEKCIRCRQCFIFCPDSAVIWKNHPEIDYWICKGCLVCVRVCPVKAIKSEREQE